MIKVGSIVKIKNKFIDDVYDDNDIIGRVLSVSKEDLSKHHKIKNITTIDNYEFYEYTIIINDEDILVYEYEIIDVTRLYKLKKLLNNG